MNSKIPLENDQKRERPKLSEVERLYASNTKAKEILGWEPSYSGLDGFKKGLNETIKWFKEKNNLVKYNSEIYNT